MDATTRTTIRTLSILHGGSVPSERPGCRRAVGRSRPASTGLSKSDAAAALSSFADAIRSMEQALVARDPYTSRHSKRVSRYAAAIARELDLPAAEQREIALAAELHDIGKIGVPDGVLSKDGRLSTEEVARIQSHPTVGESILQPLLRDHPTVRAVVRWHHERMDGRGYPDRLPGGDIPLAARIVAVADTFDAMTSARPYRRALSVVEAALELCRTSGTQLDPACVQAFLRALWRDAGALVGPEAAPLGALAFMLGVTVCFVMADSSERGVRAGGGWDAPWGAAPAPGRVDRGGGGGPVPGTKRPGLVRGDPGAGPGARARTPAARCG